MLRTALAALIGATIALGVVTGCSTPEPVEPPTAATAPIIDTQTYSASGGVVITTGTNYDTWGEYGDKSTTFTITGVDRCNGTLRINTEMQTSATYAPTDHPFHNVDWTDDQGYTRTESTLTSSNGCGEELAYGYNVQAGKKYRGAMMLDVPDNAATVDISSLYGQVFSIDITGAK